MSQAITLPFEFTGNLSQFRLPSGVAGKDALEMLAQLKRMTQEVFDCEVQIADDCDPEFPDEKNVLLIVKPLASLDQIVQKESQWVKRLRTIAPDWDAVRLSIRLPQ